MCQIVGSEDANINTVDLDWLNASLDEYFLAPNEFKKKC